MKLLLSAILGTFGLCSQAQESPYFKFGKITSDELQKKIYSINSAANAIVLSDVGDAAIEGNSKRWFSVLTTRHKVMHILNKNGYNEASFWKT